MYRPRSREVGRRLLEEVLRDSLTHEDAVAANRSDVFAALFAEFCVEVTANLRAAEAVLAEPK